MQSSTPILNGVTHFQWIVSVEPLRALETSFIGHTLRTCQLSPTPLAGGLVFWISVFISRLGMENLLHDWPQSWMPQSDEQPCKNMSTHSNFVKFFTRSHWRILQIPLTIREEQCKRKHRVRIGFYWKSYRIAMSGRWYQFVNFRWFNSLYTD